MKRYQLHVDGKAREPATGTWFETQNPFTGEAWAEIPRGRGCRQAGDQKD